MMVNEVRIEPRYKNGMHSYKVTVDGEEIYASSLDLFMNAGSVSEIHLEVHPSLINAKVAADASLWYSAESVKEAASLLRFELQVDEDLQRAFLSSIKSALDEAKNYASNDMLARSILNRIVGADVC